MSTQSPGADSPTLIHFPDGTSATYDDLRDMLHQFHDGELDPKDRTKIEYALENCPSLVQESSVIIGISRLLKNYEDNGNVPLTEGRHSDDELKRLILRKVKAEPAPAEGEVKGVPWGVIVIAALAILLTGAFLTYVIWINQAETSNPQFTGPRASVDINKQRSHFLETVAVSHVIQQSIPEIEILAGRAFKVSPSALHQELKKEKPIQLAKDESVELQIGAQVLVRGAGGGVISLTASASSNSAKTEYRITQDPGRWLRITSPVEPVLLETNEQPFGFLWHNPETDKSVIVVMMDKTKSNQGRDRIFRLPLKSPGDESAIPTSDRFDSTRVQWDK